MIYQALPKNGTSRNKKATNVTKPKTINIVACDGVTVCSYINNVICGKFTTKTLTPHPPGGRGCSYIFYLKEKFGVAHEEK